MTRKGIVVEFASERYIRFKAGMLHCPGPFTIAVEMPSVARDTVFARIEADWLPDWAVPSPRGYFPNARLIFADGRLKEVCRGMEYEYVPCDSESDIPS